MREALTEAFFVTVMIVLVIAAALIASFGIALLKLLWIFILK